MARPPFHRLRNPFWITPLTFLSLGIVGCSGVRVPGMSTASAPTLSNGDSMHAARNVADPNAPFTLLPTGAGLQKRATLLDINGVMACAPAQLSLFESRAQANGAHHTIRFTIANAGGACRLGGFPSITLLEADGSVLGDIHVHKVSQQSLAATLAPAAPAATAAVDETMDSTADEPSPQVLVTAHGQAAFQLGWTAGSNCEQVARIAIAAPGATETIVIPRALAVCEDQVLLTAVAPSGDE